jgi:hypothetical protein
VCSRVKPLLSWLGSKGEEEEGASKPSSFPWGENVWKKLAPYIFGPVMSQWSYSFLKYPQDVLPVVPVLSTWFPSKGASTLTFLSPNFKCPFWPSCKFSNLPSLLILASDSHCKFGYKCAVILMLQLAFFAALKFLLSNKLAYHF